MTLVSYSFRICLQNPTKHLGSLRTEHLLISKLTTAQCANPTTRTLYEEEKLILCKIRTITKSSVPRYKACQKQKIPVVTNFIN